MTPDTLPRSAQHDDVTELDIALEMYIALPDHDELVLDFEGHRWSVECSHCGAVWWVEDAVTLVERNESGQAVAFEFDLIEDGDGRCRSADPALAEVTEVDDPAAVAQ